MGWQNFGLGSHRLEIYICRRGSPWFEVTEVGGLGHGTIRLCHVRSTFLRVVHAGSQLSIFLSELRRGRSDQRRRPTSYVQYYYYNISWGWRVTKSTANMAFAPMSSMMLVQCLWHGVEITATTAGDVGAAGFFLLASILHS